jgi:hypothetical protein
MLIASQRVRQQMKLPPSSPQVKTVLRRIAAGAGLLALFLLAASLPRLELKPGVHYILPETKVEQAPSTALPLDATPWFNALIILSAILLAISIAIVLRSKEMRRRAWRNIRQILLYGLFIGLLLTIFSNQSKPEARPTPTPGPAILAPNVFGSGETGEQTAVPAAVSTEPLPPWATYIFSLAVMLLIGLAGFWIWRSTRRENPELAEIARQAMDGLASGRDWEDVVIRCYAEMSAAASQRRSLNRPEAMTPREFVKRLEAAGLPGRPVRTLTGLFEKARYGSRGSSSDESHVAMACLAEILSAVEQTA